MDGGSVNVEEPRLASGNESMVSRHDLAGGSGDLEEEEEEDEAVEEVEIEVEARFYRRDEIAGSGTNLLATALVRV